MDQRHAQEWRCGPDAIPLQTLPVVLRPEEGDAGRLGKAFLEPLQPFGINLVTRVGGKPGNVASRSCQARHDPAIAQGRPDLVAFGKPFVGNPDLVTRLYLDVALSTLNRETLYGGAEQGYTDYPVLRP